MNDAAFLRDLAEELEVAPDSLNADTALDEDKWDSMAVVSTIGLIDEHYDVGVTADALEQCRTVGEVLALIHEKAST